MDVGRQGCLSICRANHPPGRDFVKEVARNTDAQVSATNPRQRDARALSPSLEQSSEAPLRSGARGEQGSVGEYIQSVPPPRSHPPQRLKLSSTAVVGGTAVLGLTFLVAVFRTVRKYANPKAKRQRVVNKNKFVVESLEEYLPARRQELTPRVLRSLGTTTGFKPEEIFRKYLWYLLRERKFDHSAVDDVVYLKNAMGLSDEQTAEAIRERAQRVYNKYGTVMLNTAGMTAAGVERKATARALFSKLLYLAESEQILTPGSPAAEKASLREVFGATEEDVDKLRIVSLYEVDFDKLEGQFETDNEE